MKCTVKELLQLPDCEVERILKNKAITVTRKGSQPFTTCVKGFTYCVCSGDFISEDVKRSISSIVTMYENELQDDDEIEIEMNSEKQHNS